MATHGLIHRLTSNRAGHKNIQVKGYREEGTITTPFDMTVLNELDRFHLVLEVLNQLPHSGSEEQKLVENTKIKLLEHQQYIRQHGQDLPEIRNWKWDSSQFQENTQDESLVEYEGHH